MNHTIFIQIAAYRDPQLFPTIESLVKNAKDPSSLHLCICWQRGPDESIANFKPYGIKARSNGSRQGFKTFNGIYKKAKITVIEVPYNESKGACWARNLIQQLYTGETYTLQLDSHHRFVPEWDKKCIDMLESVRYKSRKPVLTAYLPPFNPEEKPETWWKLPLKMGFDKFTNSGIITFLPKTIDEYATLTEPQRARFYSGHFTFADGSFATEVQHDPNYFFIGEEISIAARAFTHGYDLYHPHQLVAWHEYTRQGRVKMWDDHVVTPTDPVITTNWYELDAASQARNKALFGLTEEPLVDNTYGFGRARSLREYEQYAGVSFTHQGVQKCTLDAVEPVYPLQKMYSPATWLASLAQYTSVNVTVSKEDLQADDCSFCAIILEDEIGTIHRFDLQAEQIQQIVTNGSIAQLIEFSSFRKPTKALVWPHSLSAGWLSMLTKAI